MGRGIEGAQLLVLNAAQQLAGVGEVGEIYVRTPYLAQGYMGDEKLTQERFIVNPFTKTAGDRLYQTGDLARYLPDGNIEFLGRRDHQVKIRGFRIELGEIEAVLDQHPEVRENVVIAREDIPGDKRLVAYVVPNPEQATTVSELRSFLFSKLPDYMMPSAFVLLDALPLTPNGKVDRRALPAPDQIRQEPEETFVAPRDELELQLAKIWEKVLVTQPVGVRDNFFDLGGHSLLAVRLFAQIEKKFGKHLPLATLFQTPTVEQLAGILRQRERPASGSSLVAIQPSGLKPPFFCVHEADGHVLCYRELANYLGPEQPFYGLIPQHLDGKRDFHSWIEDVAAHYVKEIRTLQPEGPYFLGGLCNGGIIAFEMAQQLHRQGQKVALLALFDAVIASPKPPKPVIRAQAHRHLNQLSQLGYIEKLTYILQKVKGRIARPIKKTIKKIKTRSELITYKIYLNNERFFPQGSQKIPARAAFRFSRRYYAPQVYQGRVTLFRVREGWIARRSPTDNPYFGWDKLAAGGFEVYDVPGIHGNVNGNINTFLKEPHVQVLANKLRDCIDKAQTND